MRILGARIFSKFFGGKIKFFNEGICTKQKTIGACLFQAPGFFGGKIKTMTRFTKQVNLDRQDNV